jgi:hypothetical protein
MRDFKGMKRQRNRGRGGGGGNGGGGGGGKPQHNANRAFDSNGPDNVKVRGAAQHIFEKYQQLARDAGSAGDRVLAENYLQHAEHYFRVLRAMQPQRPIAEILGRDQFVSGYDIDFEDEGGQGGEEPAEAEPEGASDGRRDDRPWQRDDRQRGDGQQQDRPRDERPREQRDGGDYRPREDRPQGEFRQRDDRGGQGEYRQRDDRPQGDYRPRDDRPREDRPREDRPREDRPREDRPRDDREFRPREDRQQQQGDFRPRDDRQAGGRFQRDDRPRRPDREFRQERAERDPLSVIEPQATPLITPAPAPAPYEPRDSQGVLRGEDGTMSHAPAFLQPRAVEPRPEADEAPAEARRPRRRRAPRSFEAGEAAPAEADEG